MTLALFYIILNLGFYKVSVHGNYSNFKLFIYNNFAIVEVLLFVYLFNYLKEMPRIIGGTFIVTIIIINIGRILLLSSPIFNDFVNSSFIACIYWSAEIILIFICIVLSIYFYENKIYLLFFSSLLGIVVAILLYLDFDTNISAIVKQ